MRRREKTGEEGSSLLENIKPSRGRSSEGVYPFSLQTQSNFECTKAVWGESDEFQNVNGEVFDPIVIWSTEM